MTRKEALKLWLPIIKQGVETMPELNQALDMAIEALEQQPCDDCISRQAVLALPTSKTRTLSGEIVEEEVDIELIKALPSVTLQPCDDCISRQALKRKLQENHNFFINAYGGFSNLPQNDKSRVDEIINCIAMVVNEPSVTPKEKTGHWIFVQRGKYVDIKCSECENVRVKEYAYNYTVEQVLSDKENIAKLLAEGDMQWCPNCGAKMVEPQESEG